MFSGETVFVESPGGGSDPQSEKQGLIWIKKLYILHNSIPAAEGTVTL